MPGKNHEKLLFANYYAYLIVCIIITYSFVSVPYEENVPKLMEIDKSTQGTVEDQMFYNRRTLHDIKQMRHDNPTDQVKHQFIF